MGLKAAGNGCNPAMLIIAFAILINSRPFIPFPYGATDLAHFLATNGQRNLLTVDSGHCSICLIYQSYLDSQ